MPIALFVKKHLSDLHAPIEIPKSFSLEFEDTSIWTFVTPIPISNKWLRIGFLFRSQEVREAFRMGAPKVGALGRQ